VAYGIFLKPQKQLFLKIDMKKNKKSKKISFWEKKGENGRN